MFLRQIGDMSLADTATMCLSAIITQLSEIGCPEAEYKEIVQYTILDAIRTGLKSRTEVKTSNMLAYVQYITALCVFHLHFFFVFFFSPQSVRNDYTTVMACLVKTFPDKSEFRDLVQLTDCNDPESDFFEHMKHIQVKKDILKKRDMHKTIHKKEKNCLFNTSN